MKIVVGTTSELKLRAVRLALAKLNIMAEIITHKAVSNVPDQPRGFQEITAGAKNRAMDSLKNTDADMSIGIENGEVKINEIDQNFDFPCICVITKAGDESFAFGASYFVPDWMIDDDLELGLIIQRIDPSQKEKDPVRYFSNDLIKREELLANGIACALIKILNKQKYEES